MPSGNTEQVCFQAESENISVGVNIVLYLFTRAREQEQEKQQQQQLTLVLRSRKSSKTYDGEYILYIIMLHLVCLSTVQRPSSIKVTTLDSRLTMGLSMCLCV